MDTDYGRWSENLSYGWDREYACTCIGGYIWILFLSIYGYVNIGFVLRVDKYMDIRIYIF